VESDGTREFDGAEKVALSRGKQGLVLKPRVTGKQGIKVYWVRDLARREAVEKLKKD